MIQRLASSYIFSYNLPMNEVQWTPKAIRQLRKIKDRKAQASIRNATRTLTGFPDVAGVKPLINHACDYRLRVGRYRVLFNHIGGGINIIRIEEVKKTR